MLLLFIHQYWGYTQLKYMLKYMRNGLEMQQGAPLDHALSTSYSS